MDKADVTGLLLRASQGDGQALGRAYQLLFNELQGIARAQLRPGQNQTLNTVALINESYLKLVDQGQVDVQSRVHFLALASRAMRHILIDYFRHQTAAKRGSKTRPITLDEEATADATRGDTLLALDEALDRLQTHNERLAQVVVCRFFGGMSYDEIGASLGLSARTVRMDWRKAKAWLTLELQD